MLARFRLVIRREHVIPVYTMLLHGTFVGLSYEKSWKAQGAWLLEHLSVAKYMSVCPIAHSDAQSCCACLFCVTVSELTNTPAVYQYVGSRWFLPKLSCFGRGACLTPRGNCVCGSNVVHCLLHYPICCSHQTNVWFCPTERKHMATCRLTSLSCHGLFSLFAFHTSVGVFTFFNLN